MNAAKLATSATQLISRDLNIEHATPTDCIDPYEESLASNILFKTSSIMIPQARTFK
jgi:hypothetical protein